MESQATKIVFWLTYVHPVPLQSEGEELGFGSDRGEGLPLNRSGLERDAVEHGRGDAIDTGINLVADKGTRLLNETIHETIVIHNDYTVFAGIFDPRRENGSLSRPRFMEG